MTASIRLPLPSDEIWLDRAGRRVDDPGMVRARRKLLASIVGESLADRMLAAERSDRIVRVSRAEHAVVMSVTQGWEGSTRIVFPPLSFEVDHGSDSA
jgi:hypothetical protein